MSDYVPPYAHKLLAIGSTSKLWRHRAREGVVIKSQLVAPQDHIDQRKFETELRVLTALGDHPRIVRYLGLLDVFNFGHGLLFEEAVHGDVQQYLNLPSSHISDDLRIKWCKQAAEALAYCHSKNVLHCDLRPENMLLDAKLDLSLCDFGGSTYGEYVGLGLPDVGFFNSLDESWSVTKSMELFGLGSSFYTIMTSHLPHGPRRLRTPKDRSEYEKRFERLWTMGDVPDTSGIKGGPIIMDCWTARVTSAGEVFTLYKKLEMDLKSC
ncbi:MAG: hypothetical protein M1837_000332 [Sclerophora amabilis]|nr:MAG: hypothetical protein M1837_000332 [Sclerophora amabilis]